MKRLIVVALAVLLVLIRSHVNAAPPQQYQAAITSPRANAVLKGQVSIQGTANHPEFWKYEVRVTPGMNPNVPDEQWARIVVLEQPVVNGQLAVWDTTKVPDGVYTLRLRVVRLDGQWQDIDLRPLNVANQEPPTMTAEPPTSTPGTTEKPEEPEEEGIDPTPAVLATLTPSMPGLDEAEAETAPATAEAGDGTASSGSDQPIVMTPSPGEGAESELARNNSSLATSPRQELDEAANLIDEGLDMAGLSSACFTGAALAIAVFLLIGFLYLMKSLMRTFR